MQDHRPIAFHSQALKGRNFTLFTYEKELLALVVVVRRTFVIKTDHQSLKYLLDQRVGTLAHQRWITKLLEYAFILEYKKSKENLVIDTLSRRDGDMDDTS